MTWSKRVAPSAEEPTASQARDAATVVPLYQDGPLSIYGKCFRDTGANETYGETYVGTTENNTIETGSTGAHTGVSGGYIESTSPETTRKIGQSRASSSFKAAYGDAFASSGLDIFSIRAPSGTAVTGSNVVGTKQESVEGGDGPYGSSYACLFDGYAIPLG